MKIHNRNNMYYGNYEDTLTIYPFFEFRGERL